jgi:hypothetical protein
MAKIARPRPQGLTHDCVDAMRGETLALQDDCCRTLNQQPIESHHLQSGG